MEYQDYLRDDLKLVQGHLDAAFRVEGKLMGEVADYLRSGRGKMVRPAIICLTARALGEGSSGERPSRLGAAVELFHLATLLHDDVIDNAALRRRRPTVNARWGNDVAILFADYLYATCFDYALSVLDPKIVQVLSKTTQKMTEGEMFQIERRGEWLTEADYLSIIRSKTAYLFSACSGLGAIISGAAPETAQHCFAFGMNYGMAFQITDDALDYEAQGPDWGKRVGADLAEGKQTLPLLHALETAEPGDRSALIAILNDGRDFDTVHGYVKRCHGIDYSLEMAGDFTQKALESLDHFPAGEPTEILRRLAEGVLARQA